MPSLRSDTPNRESIELLHSRASHLASQGKYRRASAAFRNAIRAAKRARPLSPLALAALLNDFGVLCKYAGQFRTAEHAYRRALRLIRNSPPGSCRDDSLATIYHNLGGIAHARRRYALGIRYARKGIALRSGIRPRDPLSLAADEIALAAILAGAQRTREALTLAGRALPVLRGSLGKRHTEVGFLLSTLGAVYETSGRLKEAKDALRRALSILEKSLGKSHPRLVIVLNNLAVICMERKSLQEAGRLFRRALCICEANPGSAFERDRIRRNFKKLQGQMGDARANRA